jgi:hypothetical protein
LGAFPGCSLLDDWLALSAIDARHRRA